MHFERIYLEDAYEGTVDEACRQLEEQIQEQKRKIADADSACTGELEEQAAQLRLAARILSDASRRFDIRRLAAFTRAKNETFFILCGWMTKKDADRLKKELDADPDIFCTMEENTDKRISRPPTKLKNPAP